VRIGTWNLAGRWDERHHELIKSMDCDVLLLTEVSERLDLEGMHGHATESLMAPRRRWSAVCSRAPIKPLDEPHGATALVETGGLRFASSILPWRSCGSRPPWAGINTAAKTTEAVKRIVIARPDVWGGDWNHAMSGPEYAGTKAGRATIVGAVESLALQVPTGEQPHRIEGLLSIDHVAVPRTWCVRAERFVAEVAGYRISDHDAYVVERN
jgi:hypothetical protein